jgi:hypothetical protein
MRNKFIEMLEKFVNQSACEILNIIVTGFKFVSQFKIQIKV